MLNVTCPHCHKEQEFVWHRERGSDFVPVPTSDIPSLDHAGWIAHWQPILTATDRRHAGMKRGEVKREDGGYDEKKVMAQTHYECFYCGDWVGKISRKFAIILIISIAIRSIADTS